MGFQGNVIICVVRRRETKEIHGGGMKEAIFGNLMSMDGAEENNKYKRKKSYTKIYISKAMRVKA